MLVISRLKRRAMNYKHCSRKRAQSKAYRLIEDRETGRSRGFGFVEMSTKEEGAAAIQKFNGQDLGGRALKVNEAKPRENRAALKKITAQNV